MKTLVYINIVLVTLVVFGFWILPPSAKAPITHSKWFRSITAIFEDDTRAVVSDNMYPWRSIGLVHGRENDDFMCSGYVVGQYSILTSAHCVIDDSEQFRKHLFFSVISHTSSAIAKYSVIEIRTSFGDTAKENGSIGEITPELDIAVLYIARDLGSQIGYFSVDLGNDIRPGEFGSMTAKTATGVEIRQDLCTDTVTKLPWDNGNDGAGADGHGRYWVSPSFDKLPKICAAGYSGDLGYARLAVANDCGLVAVENDVIVHTCFIAAGASGGPLFYIDRDGRAVAFGVNTGIPDQKTSNDLDIPQNVFIGTLLRPFVKHR